MPRDYDVAIVGAGFVGAALALGLARAGLDILLIERQPAPAGRGDGRGLALNQRSLALLTRLNVWPRLAPLAYPVKTIEVTQRGYFGSLRLSHRDLALPMLGAVCPADALLDALVTELRGLPQITLQWATRLTQVHQEAEQVALTLAGAQTGTYAAALLIGADGAESMVRQAVGLTVARRDYGQTALVANLEVTQPAPHTAFERFTEDGPMALLPQGGRRYVLVRGARTADAERLLALRDEDFLRDAEQRFGSALGTFSTLGPRRAYPLVGQHVNAVHAGRTLLLGNAANTVHPNAAQGLNLGLRDVEVALEEIQAAMSRGEDLGATTLLARYAKARAPDQRATRLVTDWLARGFAIKTPLFGALRAAGMLAVAHTPSVKRLMLRQLVFGFGDF